MGAPAPRRPWSQPWQPRRASPADLRERWGKGETSGDAGSDESRALPPPPGGDRRAGQYLLRCSWLPRPAARRAPIPAACSPRGLQHDPRRHRCRLGFIYPDGRARPGNRNAEAFSCFLTARASRRTSCWRGIQVPGP